MIPITRLTLGEAEAQAAAEAVLSGWVMQGPRTERFERTVAEYVGAQHAVAVNSCTTALHLALIAAGVGSGDEVICPSYTFIATANAIRYARAKPVFVDIDRRTYNIDPGLIEDAITEKTKAILPVNQIGLPADIPEIMRIAKGHNLLVVEDAACSLGAMIGNRRVGALSDLTCFSFDARKILTMGEGGVITTDSEDYATRLRLLRAHAASVSMYDRAHSNGVILENYPEVGYNYRLTDIQAAIGSVQMTKLDGILAARRSLALRYNDLLADEDRVELPFVPDDFVHVFQSYAVRLLTPKTQVEVMGKMAELGVATRRIISIHTQPAYANGPLARPLPETEAATDRSILLPMFVGLSEDEQDRVVSALRQAL